MGLKKDIAGLDSVQKFAERTVPRNWSMNYNRNSTSSPSKLAEDIIT